MIPIHFAPLQGYTEAAYRNFHSSIFGGIDSYYTPFVRIEKGEFRKKEWREVAPDANSVPHLIPQLIASAPDEMRQITDWLVEKGYQEIDINLGCPFPLIAKKHKGSGILPYPNEVKALLETIQHYPDIRFSAKMRLGWEDEKECIALLPLLNELPLTHLTMHPRVGKQQYKGDVNMEAFTAFYEQCTLPLIYNGDIETTEDIERIASDYPTLSGIMIGRGLLANPALAIEYRTGAPLSHSEMMEKTKELHHCMYEHYTNKLEGGEAQVLSKLKAFWEYLLPDADKKAKKAIHKSTRLSAYEEAVRKIF